MLSEDAKAERERIRLILQSDAAKGRRAAAEQLAFGTNMDATEALALLETLPAAASASAANPFAGLRRSADAPGGLVTMDNTDAPSGGAVVRSGPDGMPSTLAERNKALWANVIKNINGSEAPSYA